MVLSQIALTKTAVVFTLNILTNNYSQVDKLWSIMPVLYAWVMVFKSDFQVRQLVMAGLVTLWGVRLTGNFARKGGYSWKFWEGEEDYRWAIVRKNPLFQSKIIWHLFNFFFISLYQSFLIMSFTLPILLTIDKQAKPLNEYDYIGAFLVLFFIIFETISDNQQWNF